MNEIIRFAKQLGFSSSVKELFLQFLNGGTYLLEYRTGAGKTTLAILLSILLASKYDLKIYFFTRTHLHLIELYQRILETSNKLRKNVIILPLLGKELLCPFSNLYPDPYEGCRELRKKGSCFLYNNFLVKNIQYLPIFQKSPDLDSLVSSIFLEGVCPYYFLKSNVSTADIILTTYYHLFHPPRYTIFSPLKYVIIIDEFHNIPLYYFYNKVYELDLSEVYLALSCIRKENSSLLELIEPYLKNILSYSYYVPENIHDQYMLNQVIKSISFLVRSQCNRHYSLNEIDSLFPTLSRIVEIGNKIYKIRIVGEKIYLYYKFNDKYVKNLMQSSYLNLFISATLSPPFLYKRFLRHVFHIYESVFINKLPLINATHPIINLYIVRGFTSLYRKRTKTLYENIARSILYIVRNYGDSIVFSVSKEFTNSIYNELTKLAGIENNIVIIKSISSLDIIKSSRSTRKIFLFTHRGSLSEGINFLRDSDISNMILVGLPIPPPSKQIILMMKFSYGYAGKDKIFKYGYLHQGITSIIQAIGRLISNNRERINVFVFEDRLYKYLYSELVPGWFKSLILVKEMIIK